MIRVLDLFSCIGFHSIGLQRASPDFEIVALCESNERRRQELSRIHPGVPIYADVKSCPPKSAEVCFGGPPCQNTSVAAAIHGYRDGSSLWSYMLELGLRSGVEWFVVEQPPGASAWEEKVSHDLSSAGYHVARFEFGAHDVGAPYPRRRVYLIACTSLPRLEVAWSSGPSAIKRAKRSAAARGDWDPNSIPAFDLDTWRSEDVHERKERIEALGDSNPPAMAEVIGYMISDALQQRSEAA